jgi:deoxyribodipyrimidine photo-lyase
MRPVSDNWLLEPWKIPRDMQVIEIPMPITDLTLATKAAKQRFYERRNQEVVRSAKENIIQRHASRSNLSGQKTCKIFFKKIYKRH